MTRVDRPSIRRPHRRAGGSSRALVSVSLSMLVLLAGACGGDAEPDASASASASASTGAGPSTTAGRETTLAVTDTPATEAPSSTVAPTTARPQPSTPPGPSRSAPTTAAPPPPGDPRVTRVSAADLGASWHAGCPVGPADLRRVAVTYVGFDGAEHPGALIVHADAVQSIQWAFERLRAARFPINKVVPVDRYGGSDDASMADDNTSAFNCRRSTGSTSTWSQHAYGRAIDVNPLENPYVSGASVQPAGGAAYLDRSVGRPGMAVAGNDLVAAFAAIGWGWGGSWTTVKDYQHFSATGR